jgi:hypothetical protein
MNDSRRLPASQCAADSSPSTQSQRDGRPGGADDLTAHRSEVIATYKRARS